MRISEKSSLRCDAFPLRYALSLRKSTAMYHCDLSLRVRCRNVVNPILALGGDIWVCEPPPLSFFGVSVSLVFLLAESSWVFLSVFCLFQRIFQGSHCEEILDIFEVFLGMSKRPKKGQGPRAPKIWKWKETGNSYSK